MSASRGMSPSRPLLGAALLPLRVRGVRLKRDPGGSSDLRVQVHLAKLFGERLWGAGVQIISFRPPRRSLSLAFVVTTSGGPCPVVAKTVRLFSAVTPAVRPKWACTSGQGTYIFMCSSPG